MKPIAITQEDLLELVTIHNGTVSGIITPQVAGWLLALNTRNRPLRRTNVDRFAEIIQQGLWINTGEPIIVSRDGALLEGQHRLHGIVKAARAVDYDIRFGIAPEAMAATGTGAKRTVADVLSMSGVPNSNVAAAIAKVVWHYQRGEMGRSHIAVEPANIVATLTRFAFIEPLARDVKHLATIAMRQAWFGSVIAMVAVENDFETAVRFMRAVEEGQGARTDAARVFHSKIVQMGEKRLKNRGVERIAMGVKAWNAWITRTPIHLLRVIDAETTSGGFPTVRKERREKLARVA